MSTSNVRNIESLEAFHGGMVRLSGDWSKVAQEIRMMVQRAEAYFASDMPAYWRNQMRLAERDLTEAKEALSQKRAAARASDRLPATEEAQRVKKAEARIRQCLDKQREAKRWAIEMSQQCDAVLGPLADVVEHCDVILPAAAIELRGLIDQLRIYAEKPPGSAS